MIRIACAARSAELENCGHRFPVRDLDAILDPDIRFELAGNFDEHRCRSCMHSGAAHDLGIDVMRAWRRRSALGRFSGRLRGFAAQPGDDVVGVLGFREEFGLGRIVQHVGQGRKHTQMLIRFGGDSDDEVRDFSRSPLHSLRQLNDGDARRTDEFAILCHSVRNRNPVAQIGVRLAFPPDHAFDVARLDEARFDQGLDRPHEWLRSYWRRLHRFECFEA